MEKIPFFKLSNSMQCKAISISIERNGYYNEKHVHIYGISGILQHRVTTRSSDDQRRSYVVVGRIFCFVIHLNQPIHSKKTETMQSNKKMGCVREGLIVTCEKMCDSHTHMFVNPIKNIFCGINVITQV